jgi:uncharacterized protein YgiM (DUF1202 family)
VKRNSAITILAVLIAVIALVAGGYGNLSAGPDDAGRAARQMQVTAGSANVRSGPGTENKIVARASRGDLVLRLLSGEGWTKVQLASGQVGWIANSLLAKPASRKRPASGGASADFIAKKWKDKELLPQMTWEIRSMDDIKPFAEELVSFIDDAIAPANGTPDPNVLAERNVAKLASAGMLLMGWIH